MKNHTQNLFGALALLALSTLNSQLSTAFAQGSLVPAGAPGPTMKSLDQIEARTPISSAPFTITQPGSYYLTTNLNMTSVNSGAIIINTNNVTLDLNGFSITTTFSGIGGTGIVIGGNLNSASDVSIFNGHIVSGITNNGIGVYSGSGIQIGIAVLNFAGGIIGHPFNVRVSNVSVSGVSLYGIYLGTNFSTVVENCTVSTVGSYGIEASIVRSSMAIDCGGAAIVGDQVFDCRGQSTGGDGIIANTMVQDSYGYVTNNSSSLFGIYNNGTAQNCYGYSVNGTGLNFGFTAQNCYGYGGYSGLNGSGSAVNCYGVAKGGGYGIYVTESAIGCFGLSSSGIGLQAFIAAFCEGYSNSNIGLEGNAYSFACYAQGSPAFVTGHQYFCGSGYSPYP